MSHSYIHAVLTADQQAEVECLNLGAIDFIPKPYPQPDVILARVQRTIELFEDRRIIRSTERDTLTGLYSKEYFFRYSEQFDIQHKDIAMDAIVVDVNHFHILNERYGKTFCDDLLKRIGEKVSESILWTGGIVSRKEADTFLIYCPHRSDYENMLDSFSVELGDESGSGSRVHVRMGVYENADKNIDVERRFDRAKTAADTVHASFTKAIGFYDEDLNDREIFAEQLIENFRNALEEKQFRVFFQPKFDISPHKPILTSAEALVRWDHPELGMVSPGKFIPLFESNGLIQQLDLFVWQETARQIKEWKDRLGYAVPVSVNVSRVDLYEEDVVGTLLNIVESNGLQPNDLLLEVTESSYTENFSQIIGKVNELRAHGFRIEMDDFGTGYSSLNLISRLPIDAIKLDMGFIRDAFKEGGSTRMIEIIIDIAAFLNVPTIAEGVETEDQCKALRLMGCDIVQGYYFSKPLPADVFESFLLEGKKAKAELEAFREEETAKAKAKRNEEINAMKQQMEGQPDDYEMSEEFRAVYTEFVAPRTELFILIGLAEGKTWEKDVLSMGSAEMLKDPVKIGDCDGFTYYLTTLTPEVIRPRMEQVAPDMREAFIDATNRLMEQPELFTLKERNKSDQPPEPGTQIDFEATDLDGNPVTRADLTAGSKVTMITFWQTFCEPCKGEMPELDRLVREYGSKGLNVVGCVCDAVTESTLATAKEIDGEHLFRNVKITQSVNQALPARGTPTT